MRVYRIIYTLISGLSNGSGSFCCTLRYSRVRRMTDAHITDCPNTRGISAIWPQRMFRTTLRGNTTKRNRHSTSLLDFIAQKLNRVSCTCHANRMLKTTYVRNDSGQFVCPECGDIKDRQNTMFYHMKKHAGVMSHPCKEPGCGKAFIQKSGLQQHMMQAHAAENATLWVCPCCPHSSKMKANLTIHIGRKHGAGWIPPATDGACTGCKKEFSSVTAYYYHAVHCFLKQAPEEIVSFVTGANDDAAKSA